MKDEIIELMNDIFRKYMIDITLDSTDIDIGNQNTDYIYFSTDREKRGNEIILTSRDKIKQLLDNKSKSRIGDNSVMYHLLRFEHAVKIFETKEIQLSALSYLWENDPLEYSEFFRRTGLYHFLHNDEIFKIKDNVFVFCFSDSCRNEESWKLYGQNETGVALGFTFNNFSDNPIHEDLYLLKDVTYDNGYDFDFIIELQERLYCKYRKRLYFEGVSTFGKFYKRKKFDFEREIRLCIDFQTNRDYKEIYEQLGLHMPTEKDLDHYFKVEYNEASKRHFIRIPFKNDLFNLKISELIIGKNVDYENVEHLKYLTKDQPINIWKRK
jgi:hypothetical protein